MQPVPAELSREQILAEGDALLLAHPFEPGLQPDFLGGLDDEGRRVVVELIDVSEPLKEPFQRLWRAQAAPRLPWMVVRYPKGEEDTPPARYWQAS